MKLTRVQIYFLLTFLVVALGVITNWATSEIPPWLQPYRGWTWPALGVLTLLIFWIGSHLELEKNSLLRHRSEALSINAKAKALVVDDEDKWRNPLAAAMERLGFAVRQLDDAQLAIEVLLGDPTINMLVLDWDLRGSSRELPTALGEDVLREVIKSRSDLTVVIVTGALEKRDYQNWRQSLGISLQDDFFRITQWRPFLLISKKELEPELASGLSTLGKRLQEAGLLL